MASLVQPYVDKENATSMGAGVRKGRLQSFGQRHAVGKTFGSENVQTPRQVLGNISNDPNAVRSTAKSIGQKANIQQSIKKPALMKNPQGLSMRKSSSNTPGQPLLQKKKMTKIAPPAPIFKVPPSLLKDNLPPIEQMHIFEDKEIPDCIPAEHCLSAHLGKFLPIGRPPVRKMTLLNEPSPDFSNLTLENTVRPIFEDDAVQLPPMKDFDACLNLPPVETQDFMNINNIKLWDD